MVITWIAVQIHVLYFLYIPLCISCYPPCISLLAAFCFSLWSLMRCQVLYLVHCVLTWYYCSHSGCLFLQCGWYIYWVLLLCSINKVQEKKNYGFRKCVSCLKLYHSADDSAGRQPQWSMLSVWSDSSGQLLHHLRGKRCWASPVLCLWSFSFGWNQFLKFFDRRR